ncbi:DUF559 domain-containing protein [Pedobacter superstes]|uniref:DUF559 domain-containing protein n=1 Tax=Pedobacter superstes TaxID=3133441 RepID=UPI003D7299E7
MHNNLGQTNADFDRDNELRSMGMKVLRIENEMVFMHPEQTLEIISSYSKGQIMRQ